MSEPVKTNLRGWFDEDELHTCPFCGEKSAVATASISFCLQCGVVWLRDGEPQRL